MDSALNFMRNDASCIKRWMQSEAERPEQRARADREALGVTQAGVDAAASCSVIDGTACLVFGASS